MPDLINGRLLKEYAASLSGLFCIFNNRAILFQQKVLEKNSFHCKVLIRDILVVYIHGYAVAYYNGIEIF